MIVRSEKSEKRIVQSRFLQTKKNRIGAIQGSKSAFGQTALGFTGRFIGRGKTEGELFAAAVLENAQNISGISQVKTRQRLEERKDSVRLGVFGRDRRVVDQLQWRAIPAISLAEPIILQVEAAVII